MCVYICQIQNPGIPRAGRGGGEWDADGSVPKKGCARLFGSTCGPMPVLTSRFSCPAVLKLTAFSTSRSPLRFYF